MKRPCLLLHSNDSHFLVTTGSECTLRNKGKLPIHVSMYQLYSLHVHVDYIRRTVYSLTHNPSYQEIIKVCKNQALYQET